MLALAPDASAKEPADPGAARRRAEQREQRVGTGLAELDRWLQDQVRQGLAASQQSGYKHWDDIAARMVDAQAPGLAERLRALAAVPYSGTGWDGRLLEEYALLRLLAVAYGRHADLAPPLRDTVRSRIGFTVRQADVLAAGPPARDRWHVLARRDLDQDRLRTRRVWLRGHTTGRYALVLSFAAAGQSLDDCAYRRHRGRRGSGLLPRRRPAARPRRGPARREPAERARPGGDGGGAAGLMGRGARRGPLAGQLARRAGRDPGPVAAAHACTTRPATPCRCTRSAGDCWPLFALSAGSPLTVAGEWTPRGLWPLTAWDEGGTAVPL